MVAGLEHPTAGRIEIGSTDITGTKPYKRPVNTVFQSYALFPHMDVFENVAFGLRRRGSKTVKKQVDDVLELTELAALARRKPAQLSGGQQQRVALARAIVNKPGVLLLDEPLGALDLKLRRQMQVELKQIQTEVGLTFVHVTHDQEEAMTMADTIAVMNAGRIEQMGAPVELYELAAHGVRRELPRPVQHGPCTVTGTRGPSRRRHARHQRADRAVAFGGADGTALARHPPREAARDHRRGTRRRPRRHQGRVITDSSFIGVSTQYLVRMPWGQELVAFEQNRDSPRVLRPGTNVALAWSPDHAFGLSAAQDRRAGVETVETGDMSAIAAFERGTEPQQPPPSSGRGRRRGSTPYLLLVPGLLWLGVFFVVPMIFLVSQSLQTGSIEEGYTLTWSFSTYTDAR